MNREVHVRFCEGLGVKFPRATRPLIHTSLEFARAQDVGVSQRFSGLGNALPQTGHIFSVGLIIRLALHLEHLTGLSLTRLISSGSRLVIMFLRARKVLLWRSETGK